jgi:integrase/recombinase XerD
MLTLYRRHRAKCKNRSRRSKSCTCPVWVQGVLDGEPVRESLDLTNWEAATKKMREWELGHKHLVTAREALDKFQSDRESMKLSDAMLRKYKHVVLELKTAFGDRDLRSITVDDVRGVKDGWKSLAAITQQKRLDLVRKFFSFCVDSNWLDKSPAKPVKTPPVKHVPTLPFTDGEMEKILWAAESIREAHPKMPEGQEKKLKALILLMRYSGVRISDAVMFKRSMLTGNKLLLTQEKTKELVWVPLPDFVVEAIAECDKGNEYYFYSQVGTPKSAITDWQWRLRKVYDMAGIPDGHSHRLRDTFSVAMLSKGVPIEDVSRLLGHKDIRVTQRHYAPWVKARQDALELAVKASWTAV